MGDDLTVLRPSLGKRRIPFMVLSLPILAIGIGGLFFAPVAGVIVTVFGLFAVGLGIARLVLPRSYATELDDEGFRTFDSWGRRMHEVRWADVEHLTVFQGNGFRGPGTELHLAWRCRPRCRRGGIQPWLKGGRNALGEEFDGALPDPYLGYEAMVELFRERADAAKAKAAGTGAPAPAPAPFEAF
jgi:hypothetical protein